MTRRIQVWDSSSLRKASERLMVSCSARHLSEGRKPIAIIQNGQNERTRHIRPQYPEFYPAKLSLVNQQFSEWMMDHSQAKVVVIFGAANAKRFLKRFPTVDPYMRPGHKYVCWQSPHPTTDYAFAFPDHNHLQSSGKPSRCRLLLDLSSELSF